MGQPKIKIPRTIPLYGVEVCDVKYTDFIDKLTSAKIEAQKLYPEVNDEDIRVEWQWDDGWDELNVFLSFETLESDEEYNERIEFATTRDKLKLKNCLMTLKECIENNPDVKDEVLKSILNN